MGVMKPAKADVNYEYDAHDDPMMGGNSVIAQARKEAAQHGYKKVSGLTNFNAPN